MKKWMVWEFNDCTDFQGYAYETETPEDAAIAWLESEEVRVGRVLIVCSLDGTEAYRMVATVDSTKVRGEQL